MPYVLISLNSPIKKGKKKTDQDNIRRFVSVAKKYTEITELSTEILHDFIQKIVVHAPDNSSGKRIVQLDIYYNFIGRIDA